MRNLNHKVYNKEMQCASKCSIYTSKYMKISLFARIRYDTTELKVNEYTSNLIQLVANTFKRF